MAQSTNVFNQTPYSNSSTTKKEEVSTYNKETGVLTTSKGSYSVAPSEVSKVATKATGSPIVIVGGSSKSSGGGGHSNSKYDVTKQTAPKVTSIQETKPQSTPFNPFPVNLAPMPEYNKYQQTVPTQAIGQETQYVKNQGLIDTEKLKYEAGQVSLGREAREQFKKGGPLGIASGTTLAAASFVGGAGKAIYRTPEFFSPITYEGKFQVPIIEPTANLAQSVVSGELKKYAYSEPFEFAGSLVGGALGGKLIGGTVTYAKNKYVAFGSEKISPTQVYSEQVLSGKRRLPEATSTQQSLDLFKSGTRGRNYDVEGYTRYKVKEYRSSAPKDYLVKTESLIAVPEYVKGYNVRPKIVVSTAGPGKLTDLKSGMGAKGAAGLEDPGIYVTAYKEGSPYFHRMGKNDGYGFSINPLKSFEGVFKQPTVTEFIVRDVKLQPRNIVNEPGFYKVKEFFEKTGSKEGVVYITKRSEIGQGSLPRQRFIVKEDIIDPWTNRPVKAGTSIWEKGTSEQEGVIPLNTLFKYKTQRGTISKLKGYSKYTESEGINIPIREAKLISLGKNRNNIIGSKQVSVLAEEQNYLNSYVSGKKSVTPYESLINLRPSKTFNYKQLASSNKYTPYDSYKSTTPVNYSTIVGSKYSGSNEKDNYYYGNDKKENSIYYPTSEKRRGRRGSEVIPGSSYSPWYPKPIIPDYSYKPNYNSKRGTSYSRYHLITNTPKILIPDKYISSYSSKDKKYKSLNIPKSLTTRTKSGVFILPDLRSVSITEARSYAKYGKGEAIAPRATKSIKGLSYAAFKGLSTGYVPTEQIRVNKL